MHRKLIVYTCIYNYMVLVLFAFNFIQPNLFPKGGETDELEIILMNEGIHISKNRNQEVM